MSHSIVVTPISSARWKDGSVFSGSRPRAPRWPCRSKVEWPAAVLAVGPWAAHPERTSAARQAMAVFMGMYYGAHGGRTQADALRHPRRFTGRDSHRRR